MTNTAKEILKVLHDLKAVVNLPTAIKIHRTRAGRGQRSAGAWSWYAVDSRSGMEVCGSQYTCKEIIQAHHKKLVETCYYPWWWSSTPDLVVSRGGKAT